MKKSHLVFLAIVVVAVVAYLLVTRRGGEDVALDLFVLATTDSAEYRPAEKKAERFKTGPETVSGDTKPALYMHAPSRVIFKDITVPDNGRLTGWIAVKEDAWTQEASDGVLFRFGVDDGIYNELLNQLVDPRHNANDRGWLPVDIDLSAFAGQKVKLIFNTNTSLPGHDNPAFDYAVWGEPSIITRP